MRGAGGLHEKCAADTGLCQTDLLTELWERKSRREPSNIKTSPAVHSGSHPEMKILTKELKFKITQVSHIHADKQLATVMV